jgi:hypothetical protein
MFGTLSVSDFIVAGTAGPLLQCSTIQLQSILLVSVCRDKPRLLSAGETQAALFNIACVQSRLGNVQDGLIAVAGCLEAGVRLFLVGIYTQGFFLGSLTVIMKCSHSLHCCTYTRTYPHAPSIFVQLAGYDNFSQLRSDPDLDALRSDEKFEGLLRRFERRGFGF